MSDDKTRETELPANETGRAANPALPDALLDLPEDQREEAIQFFRDIVHVEQTTGLMPPPSMLAAYSADVRRIIVEEFAQHGQHRRTSESKVIEASIQRERRGMWLGFVLAFSLIVCGALVILAGYSAEGLALIAADAAVLAVVYIFDRRSREA